MLNQHIKHHTNTKTGIDTGPADLLTT